MIHVTTHRGLDPSIDNYFFESSKEAFEDQLTRGYGLEFDVRVTADGQFVITHDKTLERISGGADTRNVTEATMEEIKALELNGYHLTDLDTLCAMIAEHAGNSMSALHMKSESQIPEIIAAVIETFKKHDLFETCIVFDTTIETAKQLKAGDERFHIAPSVSHEYDIERYNDAVGGTLYSVEEVIDNKNVFDWVWLDEWDREDKDGGEKTLVNQETFSTLREHGFKIGLVTPELHASSPGLLGGEAHGDAADMTTLEARLQEIVRLNPDLMCTDYPDRVRSMIEGVEDERKVIRENSK